MRHGQQRPSQAGLLAGRLAIFIAASVLRTDIAPAQQEKPDTALTLPPVEVIGTNTSAQAVVQSMPEAVSSLSRTRLDEIGINSPVDLSKIIPNFSQSHAGLRSYTDIYSIRGLGNTEFLSDPAVVMYVDDVPYDNVVSYETDLLSVERVDVYRGPQGTRFGKNAEAGLMNIITRKPGPNFEAEGRATVGSFNSQEYELLAMGPIKQDKLAFSLSGQYSTSDGYIHNTFLNSHSFEQEGLNGRANLIWAPGENWEVEFTLSGRKSDNGIGLTPLNTAFRTTQSDFNGRFDDRFNSQSLRIQGNLDGLTLTSITARRDYTFDPFKFDLDFSPITGNTATVERVEVSWSVELRLQPSTPGEQWNWQAGFFFSTADAHLNQRGDFFIPPGISVFQDYDVAESSHNYALFGNCTRNVGDSFSIAVGFRLDETMRQMDRTFQSTFGPSPPIHADGNFFNVAPDFTLSYHVSDALLLYGKTGLGFKAGGFSPYVEPPIPVKFETETAWASEVGAKSSWMDGRVTANVALFYNDVWDYQVEQFIPNGFNLTIVNAPRAHIMGLELETTTRPCAGLELSAFSGLMDARLHSYTDPFTGQTVHDTHPPFVPNFNAGVAAQYRLASGPFARVDYTGVGETFYDAVDSSAFKQSAYAVLEARIGFERQHWAMYFFIQNLTDAQYFAKKVPPLNAGTPGVPRAIGLMATAKY